MQVHNEEQNNEKKTLIIVLNSSPEMKKKIATKNIGHFVTGCGKKKKKSY